MHYRIWLLNPESMICERQLFFYFIHWAIGFPAKCGIIIIEVAREISRLLWRYVLAFLSRLLPLLQSEIRLYQQDHPLLPYSPLLSKKRIKEKLFR
jgi:hypothetical protein